MIRLIEYCVEYVLEHFLLLFIPKSIRTILGKFALAAFLFGLTIASAYNLYSSAYYGLIYYVPRHGTAEWIAYGEHPIAFPLWTLIYTLPFVILGLAIYGYYSSKRTHKRSAFRQFVDGSGPAPIMRPWNPGRGSSRGEN